MPKRMILLAALAATACSQAEDEGGPRYDTQAEPPAVRELSADAAGPAESAAMRAPVGIGVTAAPGVAFNYFYAFSVEAARIAPAQEVHAAACEKLGAARCRIVGMRYDLRGEDRIEAMLALKLEPGLARTFAREGIAAIERADGRLLTAAITGTDVGTAIDRAGDDRSRAEDELARLDRELARPGLRPAERSELQRQRDAMVRRIEAARATAAQGREQLANTPVTFEYRSGPAIRGFDPGAPLKSALDTLSASAQATLAVLLGALALLGPPALVVALVVLAWRRLRPRRAGRPEAPPPVADTPA